MSSSNLDFRFLKTKEILAILDGDKQLGMLNINGLDGAIALSMPYLSGPMLCNISTRFGRAITYHQSGALSRRVYLEELLDYCIKKGIVSKLLSFLFSKEQFKDILLDQEPAVIEYAHKQIVEAVIEEINKILYFSDKKLINNGVSFIICDVTAPITIEAPSIKI